MTAGKLQVELALAYLTCCPNGISETELEDTLSIDDDFLTTVFQVIWKKINFCKQHLKMVLTETVRKAYRAAAELYSWLRMRP